MTDLDVDPRGLVMHGPKAHLRADLHRAFQTGVVRRSVTEAATLELTVVDVDYRLTGTGLLDDNDVWLDVDKRGFQLTASGRQDNGLLTLTFTDQVAVILKGRSGHMTWPKGKRRSGFVSRICRDAHVHALVQRSPELTKTALERASADSPHSEDSWTATGRLADEVGWRRFSDGDRVIFGSDAWLMARWPAIPVHRRTRKHAATPGVIHVSWDIDIAQRDQQATITAALHRWQAGPGQAVHLYDQGPASGLWLVDTVERPLTSKVGTITLTRRQRTVAEAKAATAGDGGRAPSTSPGERASDTGGGSSGRVEAMIRWGVAHDNLPYVWGGGHGGGHPSGYDCSGFVSAAVHAAGGNVSGTVRTIYNECRARGTVISVSQAARTRGALLFALGTSTGGNGDHIGISLGDGKTLEARSHKDGIGVFSGGASWSGWNAGAVVPGF